MPRWIDWRGYIKALFFYYYFLCALCHCLQADGKVKKTKVQVKTDTETLTFPDDFGEYHYEFSDEEIIIWSRQPDHKILKLLHQKDLTLDRLAELLGNNISRAARIYRNYCRTKQQRKFAQGRTKATVLHLSTHLRRNLPTVGRENQRFTGQIGMGVGPRDCYDEEVAAGAEAGMVVGRPAVTSPLPSNSRRTMGGSSRSTSPNSAAAWTHSEGSPEPSKAAVVSAGASKAGSRPVSSRPATSVQERAGQSSAHGTAGDAAGNDTSSSPQQLRKLFEWVAPHMPCSDQDLLRPSFRFTYNVLSTVMKKTGFATECLKPFERLFGRDQCLDFIQSVIDCVRREQVCPLVIFH